MNERSRWKLVSSCGVSGGPPNCASAVAMMEQRCKGEDTNSDADEGERRRICDEVPALATGEKLFFERQWRRG